jgi:hypothetical protein
VLARVPAGKDLDLDLDLDLDRDRDLDPDLDADRFRYAAPYITRGTLRPVRSS